MIRVGVFVIFVGFLSLSSDSFAAKKKDDERFKHLELFNKVLYLIENQYYRQVDVEKLVNGAIRGMIQTLDPHSAFLGERIFKRMQEETQGEFGGLGIEVSQKDGSIIVITPIEDSPAFKAGIKGGDKIVEINHDSIVGMTLQEAVEKMRGKPNTKITIGVVRAGAKGVKHFTLKRKVIKLRPVKYFSVLNEYIFIRLTQFQKNSAKLIVEGIKKIRAKMKRKKKQPRGIILDLRSNPGGLLDEAVKVSSIFLKSGIVVSTEGRDPKQKEIRYVIKTGHKELELPVVVLINGSSASASEIVAGALQDAKRAIIMGSRSFGKGSVQSVAKVEEKKGIKLTIAQYMTPSGRKIQAIGIVPDVQLDEFDAKWVQDHKRMGQYIREIDLRNHLTATIETPEEKKMRLHKERQQRAARIQAIREKEKKEALERLGKKAKKAFQKYNPETDFQVVQAVNYLKSYYIYKKIHVK